MTYRTLKPYVVELTTTDGTATAAIVGGTSPGDRIKVNSFYPVNMLVSAVSGATTDAWEIKALVTKGATDSSIALSDVQINQLGSTGWSAAPSVDTLFGTLTATVTGAASTEIQWTVTVS